MARSCVRSRLESLGHPPRLGDIYREVLDLAWCSTSAILLPARNICYRCYLDPTITLTLSAQVPICHSLGRPIMSRLLPPTPGDSCSHIPPSTPPPVASPSSSSSYIQPTTSHHCSFHHLSPHFYTLCDHSFAEIPATLDPQAVTRKRYCLLFRSYWPSPRP